jgi:hypothetical protein
MSRVAVAVIAVLFVSCGGETGDEDPETATTPTTATTAAATTDSDVTTTTAAAPEATEPADSGQEIVLEGGTATFTLDGEQTDFEFFFCAFGYESTQDDEIIFLGFGESTDSAGVPVQVMVQLWDSLDQDSIRDGLQEVAYFSDGDLASGWNLAIYQDQEDIQGEEEIEIEIEIEIEEGQVTANGTFENGAGEQAEGSLEATCSPNSIGR